MALSDQELKEIAYLARINIKDESLPSLKKELEDILGIFKNWIKLILQRLKPCHILWTYPNQQGKMR